MYIRQKNSMKDRMKYFLKCWIQKGVKIVCQMNASKWLKSFRQVQKRMKIIWLFTYNQKFHCHLLQWQLLLSNQWIVLWRMEWESTQIPQPGMSIIELNYSMTSYIKWIQLIISIANSLSNTLMKLAKGSNSVLQNLSSKPLVNFKHYHLVQNWPCKMILSGKLFMSVTKTLIEEFFTLCCMFGQYVEGLEFSSKKFNRCRRYLCWSAKISWRTSCLFENIPQTHFLRWDCFLYERWVICMNSFNNRIHVLTEFTCLWVAYTWKTNHLFLQS